MHEHVEVLIPRPEQPNFYLAYCTCQVCGHTEEACFPGGANPDRLECARCGQMASKAEGYVGYAPRENDGSLN